MKWVRWVYVRLKAGSVKAWSGGILWITCRASQLLNIQMLAIILALCWPRDTPERTSNYERGKICGNKKKEKNKKKKVEIFITKNYNVRCNAIWLKCRKVQDAGQLLIVPLSRTTQHGSYTAQQSYRGKSSAVVLGQRWGRDPSSNKHSTNPNDGW